jgi:hypothetical protein
VADSQLVAILLQKNGTETVAVAHLDGWRWRHEKAIDRLQLGAPDRNVSAIEAHAPPAAAVILILLPLHGNGDEAMRRQENGRADPGSHIDGAGSKSTKSIAVGYAASSASPRSNFGRRKSVRHRQQKPICRLLFAVQRQQLPSSANGGSDKTSGGPPPKLFRAN